MADIRSVGMTAIDKGICAGLCYSGAWTAFDRLYIINNNPDFCSWITIRRQMVESLQSSVKYLEERGIAVNVYSETNISCQRTGDITLSVSGTTKDGFVLVSWECCPGPGPDDFRVRFKTLDEILLAVWSFYFAKPVIVNGWIIPLHRRPYWDLPRLQYRLANVSHIDAVAFKAIEDLRRQRVALSPQTPAIGLVAAECIQFLPCQHQTRIDHSLMLRRDLEEGYVVVA